MWGAIGTPISLGKGFGPEYGFVIDTILIVGVIVITQWLFLCPRGNLAIRLNEESRPIVRSVIIAALMAMLLSLGVAASLFELSDCWLNLNPLVVSAVTGIVWLVWAAIFYIYWRGKDRKTYLIKMLKWLFGGSILELLVATPVHAMVWKRAKDGCYCEQGSYTGLVLGGVVLVWTFGPGIVLLFMHEKQRREPLLSNVGDE
jgi:hypothetical protein